VSEDAGGAGSHRVWAGVLGALALALAGWHGLLHHRLIGEEQPLTVREAAFIRQSAELQEHGLLAAYAWAGQPEQANLYGPVYPVSVLPLLAVWPDEPYRAHRMAVGLALLAGAGLLGWGVARGGGGWVNGGVAAAWFYAAQASSPSLAAGPDLLAALLYVAAIVVIRLWGLRWPAVMVAVGLGLVGMLVKPYVVLVVPALVLYLWLAAPLRVGLAGGLGVAAAAGLGALVVDRLWPAYRYSVLELHGAFATRSLGEMIGQVVAFAQLNPALLVLGLALAVVTWRGAGAVAGWGARWRTGGAAVWRERGRRPLLAQAPGWDSWMVGVAAVALCGRLAWHGGAFLIYFNHLLLPPLLLLVLGRTPLLAAGGADRWPGWRPALVAANLLLLTLLRPPLPLEEQPQPIPVAGRMLVDPVLEPLTRLHAGVELVDNGQAEYLVQFALQRPDSPAHARAHAWEQELARRIAGQEYASLWLAPEYNRRPLLFHGQPASFLLEHYEPMEVRTVRPYFRPFRDRSRFGRAETRLIHFRPRARTATAASSS